VTVPPWLPAIVNALISAGATEEIIAAAVKAGGDFGNSPPRQRGRRRQYADDAARQRAWQRRNEIRDEIPAPDAQHYEIRNENQASAGPRNEIRNEIPIERPPDAGRNPFRLVPIQHLRGRLEEASRGTSTPRATSRADRRPCR